MSNPKLEAPPCRVYALPYQANPGYRFARIAHAPGAVLLDSGHPCAQQGRFDIFSAWPQATFTPNKQESGHIFLQRLRLALQELGPAQVELELPFIGGLMGFFSYEFGRSLEKNLSQQTTRDLDVPTAQLGLYSWACISDHHHQTSQLVFHPATPEHECQRLIETFSSQVISWPPPQDFQLLTPFVADQTADTYQQAIERIQAYIQAGDCYQVNYAQRFQAPCRGNPWHAYQQLRTACPTPFAGYLTLKNGAVLSLSPERFLHVRQGYIETRPIKGTRPRHSDPQQDQALANALCSSLKDRAENLMIVDLLRNDLGRSCQIGSIRVPECFTLESYPNVHHLVSCITGILDSNKDTLDLLAGSFPGGSITGAPKIRAMQIIDELEPTARSVYCGSLLYLDVRGEMDSSIAIRSVLINHHHAYCWGGGGIVMDSDWQSEYQESISKIRVLMHTLEHLITHH